MHVETKGIVAQLENHNPEVAAEVVAEVIKTFGERWDNKDRRLIADAITTYLPPYDPDYEEDT